MDAAELDDRLVQLERDQRAASDRLADDEIGLIDDALSAQRRCEQRIAIVRHQVAGDRHENVAARAEGPSLAVLRSEEHTSELQSLMRISYAVFCLKKKITTTNTKKDAT